MTNGIKSRNRQMKKGTSMSRKKRKMEASRDGWKIRAAEKQADIRKLRDTIRDLTASRDLWKSRCKELEQRVRQLEQHSLDCLQSRPTEAFFGG